MDRGEVVWEELHRLKEKYPKPDTRMGFEHPKVEEWLGNLNDEDFTAMIMLRIGHMPRIHYTQIRKRVKKDMLK